MTGLRVKDSPVMLCPVAVTFVERSIFKPVRDPARTCADPTPTWEIIPDVAPSSVSRRAAGVTVPIPTFPPLNSAAYRIALAFVPAETSTLSPMSVFTSATELSVIARFNPLRVLASVAVLVIDVLILFCVPPAVGAKVEVRVKGV